MKLKSMLSVGAIAITGAVAVNVEAQVIPNAEPTIFLERGPGSGSTPMNIAYHPDFDYYYGSNGGNPSFSAWTWDSNGNRMQDLSALGIDARSWSYNPASGDLQVVSYNAINGGGGYGLIEAQVDGSGFLTGGTSTILSSMPGLASSQTVPGYDPVNNLFYSRDQGSTVNEVDGATGSLIRSFDLDLNAVGNPSVTSYAIAYAPEANLLIVTEASGSEAHAFDINGAYVGTSQLDISAPSSFSMGYANGQLFVFDSARNGWQGYRVVEGGVFSLDVSGSCPGSMTFTASGATPTGNVGFVYAFSQGSCTIPNGPCAGTQLDLSCSSATLGATATADANGDATVTRNVPASACGSVFVQAVDGATCSTSDVVGL